jgi:putative aminopeptidase FrvX
MSLNNNLEKLSNACGITGRETRVRELMIQLMKPYVDEIKVDKLENVIAIKKGKESAPKIMIAAHMDEVGLMVKTITKDGFLQFSKMGGIDNKILPALKVIVYSRNDDQLLGIIGFKPLHIQRELERKKIVQHEELFIDIGAESKEDVAKLGVAIGDPIGFDAAYTQLGRDVVIGKAFDDRVGCATMIEVLKLMENHDCTICAVGTVQEEVGLRGAATAAYGIDPDFALVLDVTVAGDVPGVREYDTSAKIGKGPTITISDSGFITHNKILRLLIDTAEQEKIPFQLESGLLGTTDAARISLTRQGVPSGVISIPTRYIHSPMGMINLIDAENSAKLTAATIQKMAKGFQ